MISEPSTLPRINIPSLIPCITSKYSSLSCLPAANIDASVSITKSTTTYIFQASWRLQALNIAIRLPTLIYLKFMLVGPEDWPKAGRD